MDPKGLRVTKDEYFSVLTHTKQLLSVTFCDTTVGIESGKRRQAGHWTSYGRTDVNVEIAM